MRIKQGASLYQYMIVISLVILSVVPIYLLLGENIIDALSKHLSFLTTNNEIMASNRPLGPRIEAGSIKAGGLGGNKNDPKSECSGEICAIDFGDFILNGVPENLGDFIETAGTSGGTHELADILEQLSEQMVDNDLSDGNSVEDFKLIANLGHFSANIQEAGELAAKNCTTVADPKTCFNSASNDFIPTDITASEEIQKLLPRWPTPTKNTGYSADSYSGMLGKLDLGWATQGYGYPDLYPSIQIMKAYDRIMAADETDGVTTEMKEISTAMIKQIDTLNDNLKNVYFKVEERPGQWQNTDPITKRKKWERGTGNGNLEEVVNPKTSKEVDLRSIIFCATGRKNYDGSSCR